jgi:hypothetical protein
VKIMLMLHGDEPAAAIDAYLAAQHASVVRAFRLDPDEVATITEIGEAPAVVERTGSDLRAWWIIDDVASRERALELARDAPGERGTLAFYETYVPADFGAPPGTQPPPPHPVAADKHRYAAFIDRDAASDQTDGRPTTTSLESMNTYWNELEAAGAVVEGLGLKGSARGSRVRRSARQRIVRDGPFTEAKELIGGYMIVQARTLDEAVDLCRPWPRLHRRGQGSARSSVEVRRVVG